VFFEFESEITEIEVIAVGRAIRELRRLEKMYGPGRWRKLKGLAAIRLVDGTVVRAELHWYEAHGVGRCEFKVKRLMD
jgi:hypothetical protein